MAPRATLLPIRVMDRNDEGDVVSAVNHAIDMGADIINLLLGAHDYYGSLEHIIDYAAQHKVIMVASSGNDGSTHVTYPAQMAWWQEGKFILTFMPLVALIMTTSSRAFPTMVVVS